VTVVRTVNVWLQVQVGKVRKAVQVTAFVGPAIALLLLTLPHVSSRVAMGLFTFALGVQSLGQAGFVANISDVAPYNAGQLFGLCNTFGSFAGIVGVSAAGMMYEATGSFNSLFYLSAALYAIAAVVFGTSAKVEVLFDRRN
jgi:nitrate/nitrite transporter NarK